MINFLVTIGQGILTAVADGSIGVMRVTPYCLSIINSSLVISKLSITHIIHFMKGTVMCMSQQNITILDLILLLYIFRVFSLLKPLVGRIP